MPVSSCIRSRLSPLVGEAFFAAYWVPSGPPPSTIDTLASSCSPSSPLAAATPTPCGSRSGGSPEKARPSARPDSGSSPPCGPRSVGSTWGLADHPTSPTLGASELPSHVLDGGSSVGRAREKFPRLTSLRMLMSLTLGRPRSSSNGHSPSPAPSGASSRPTSSLHTGSSSDGRLPR
jgi:hypothetical protein